MTDKQQKDYESMKDMQLDKVLDTEKKCQHKKRTVWHGDNCVDVCVKCGEEL